MRKSWWPAYTMVAPRLENLTKLIALWTGCFFCVKKVWGSGLGKLTFSAAIPRLWVIKTFVSFLAEIKMLNHTTFPSKLLMSHKNQDHDTTQICSDLAVDIEAHKESASNTVTHRTKEPNAIAVSLISLLHCSILRPRAREFLGCLFSVHFIYLILRRLDILDEFLI